MKSKYKIWQFEYDFLKNKELYESIQTPASANCDCAYCKNFFLAKGNIYPSEITDLYSMLGIEIQKEVYIAHCARKEAGLHFYDGAHVCIGHVLTADNKYLNAIRRYIGLPEVHKYKKVNERFSLLISEKVILPSSPVLDPHKSEMFQINFFAVVPWVLESEPEPTD
jgi:hypothetical protein